MPRLCRITNNSSGTPKEQQCLSTNTIAPPATSTQKRSRSSPTPRSPPAHTAAAISSASFRPPPSASKAAAGTPTATATPNPNPPATAQAKPAATPSPALIRSPRRKALRQQHQLLRPQPQHPYRRLTKNNKREAIPRFGRVASRPNLTQKKILRLLRRNLLPFLPRLL